METKTQTVLFYTNLHQVKLKKNFLVEGRKQNLTKFIVPISHYSLVNKHSALREIGEELEIITWLFCHLAVDFTLRCSSGAEQAVSWASVE